MNSIYLFFGMVLVLANAPFLSDRVLLLFRSASRKSVLLRFLELAFFYGALIFVLSAEETRLGGSTYQQGWEFFIVTSSVFLVAAYPGFVYRYLWKIGT